MSSQRRAASKPTTYLPSVTVLRQLQADFDAGYSRLRKGDWWLLDHPMTQGIARMGNRLIRGHRQAPFRDLFVAMIIDLVEEYWPQLHRCRRPRCRAVFVKVGKEAYCSSKCSNRTRWDRFKSRPRPRDYHREREQAIRKKRGPLAKVKVMRSASPKTPRSRST